MKKKDFNHAALDERLENLMLEKLVNNYNNNEMAIATKTIGKCWNKINIKGITDRKDIFLYWNPRKKKLETIDLTKFPRNLIDIPDIFQTRISNLGFIKPGDIVIFPYSITIQKFGIIDDNGYMYYLNDNGYWYIINTATFVTKFYLVINNIIFTNSFKKR